MVTARRSFAGSLPLDRFTRLAGSLASPSGTVDYALDFDRDELGIAYIGLRATTLLTLTCQRTLEPFQFPVAIDTRLGLIGKESEEAGLPAGYEPLLTADGQLNPVEVIEDELILALPVVPLSPGADAGDGTVWSSAAEESEVDEERVNPFAQLSRLKHT